MERQPRFVAGTAMGSTMLSMALAQAGEIDRAVVALEQALAKGFRDVPGLHGSRHFEPLRRDRRFAALLARYEIPPAGSADPR